jgi:hypothetical protein
MSFFIDLKNLYPKIKILILGAYNYEYKPILDRLVNILRDKGFKQTYLTSQIIKEPKVNSEVDREAYIYEEIENIMLDFDFNIFIIFPNKNNSVIAELTSFTKSKEFKEKSNRVIVYHPHDYYYTIVKGLIIKNKLVTFAYLYYEQIYQHCFYFIKRNLV